MAVELISFGLGANWIKELFKKLKRLGKKRVELINKINNELFIEP